MQGVHYIGGRFVPPHVQQEFKLQLPEYPGSAMCVKLSPRTPADAIGQAVADMRLDDASLVGGLTESNVLLVRTLQVGQCCTTCLPTYGEMHACAGKYSARAGSMEAV